MENQKRRTANFSNDDKKLLAELVMKFKNIVENKRTDAVTNSQKSAGWEQLAQEFNSNTKECYRTANNLKTCWENIKRNTKKQVSQRKKEMFKTGGGMSQPPPENSENVIVEAVLGPALEGLSNRYDCDGSAYNEPSTGEAQVEPAKDGITKWSPISDEQQIVVIIEEEKENNYCEQKSNPGTSQQDEGKTHCKNKELWENWTPKSLKRPIAEPLRSNNSGDDWVKRRRPKIECSADTLIKEKILMVKMLKKNAEEEGNLRILILQEQLKQEKIKTQQLLNSD